MHNIKIMQINVVPLTSHHSPSIYKTLMLVICFSAVITNDSLSAMQYHINNIIEKMKTQHASQCAVVHVRGAL